MTRPFRFGVATGNARSRAEWIAKARKVEDLGYATLLVPDHITTGLAPLTDLAIAADATTRLRVGSLVFCNDFRHPALLAKEAATLDLLSDGRFELGMGAGYMPSDYTQAGIPFESPGMRVGRLEEALQVIDRLFSGETVNFAGQYYRITDLQSRPRPVQQPRPPIYIGGSGKRLLTIAARRVESIGIGFMSWGGEMTAVKPEDIAQKVAWVREAAGDRFDQIELGYTIFQMNIAERKEQQALPLSLHQLSGSLDQITEEILARRERYGFSYVQVMEPHMEAFAPVVARLAGK
ncbi:MAG: TIGR03621 family F420-dependent LLM class oxidoreductase [Ktedonobacteraceae bacterium]|nr:TIGR03621 family F420-dependent LLM class oxidoreductase [Ktedonobacteraceae bacterium]